MVEEMPDSGMRPLRRWEEEREEERIRRSRLAALDQHMQLGWSMRRHRIDESGDNP
jgi:hypothetical protein